MKYMLIDVTAVETTAVLAIATNPRIVLLGKIQQAQGRKVIAPPLEGRSFSKLEKLPLQYLYWSICKETPPDDYSELLRQCLTKLDSIPVDETPLEELEREVARLYPEEPVSRGEKKAARDPGAPPARPKATSTTGRVWEIADSLMKGNVLPERKAVIAACEAEGINPATASTQYGKWKASKSAVPGA